MKKVEHAILRTLFEASEGLIIFTLYRRLSVEPAQLFDALNKLIEQNLVQKNEERIFITPQGKEKLVASRLKSDIYSINKADDGYYSNSKSDQLKINEFYLPKGKRLHQELLGLQQIISTEGGPKTRT